MRRVNAAEMMTAFDESRRENLDWGFLCLTRSKVRRVSALEMLTAFYESRRENLNQVFSDENVGSGKIRQRCWTIVEKEKPQVGNIRQRR